VYEALSEIARVASDSNAETAAPDDVSDGDTITTTVGSNDAVITTVPSSSASTEKIGARYGRLQPDPAYALLAAGTVQDPNYAAHTDAVVGSAGSVGDDHVYEAPCEIARVASVGNADTAASDDVSDGNTVTATVSSRSASCTDAQTATFATVRTNTAPKYDQPPRFYASPPGSSMVPPHTTLPTDGQENTTNDGGDVDGSMYTTLSQDTYYVAGPGDEDSSQYKDVAPTSMSGLQPKHGPDAGGIAMEADDVYTDPSSVTSRHLRHPSAVSEAGYLEVDVLQGPVDQTQVAYEAVQTLWTNDQETYGVGVDNLPEWAMKNTADPITNHLRTEEDLYECNETPLEISKSDQGRPQGK
jgi:hypothetical protein